MKGKTHDGWFVADSVKGFEAFTVQVRAEVVDGQPRITALHIDPRDADSAAGLTKQRLATLPLQALANIAVSITDFRMKSRLRDDLARITGAKSRAITTDARASTTPEQVAEVWLRAFHDPKGKPPREAVVTELKISERTAQNYIQQARDLGYITAPKRGTKREAPE